MKECLFNQINARYLLLVKMKTWGHAARMFLLLIASLILSCSEQEKNEFQSIDESTPLELPDGSLVTLRQGARLGYSDDFASGSRRVIIDGEGYFEIKHDPRHRFVVYCHGVAVTVLGTSFNVRLSSTTGEVEVTVTEGKVNVSDALRNFGDLLSQERVVIDPASHESRYSREPDLGKTLSWYYEGLATGNRGLGTAISALERRYGTHIVLENKALQDCSRHFQPDFESPVEDILRIFVTSINARLIKTDDGYIIRGGQCD